DRTRPPAVCRPSRARRAFRRPDRLPARATTRMRPAPEGMPERIEGGGTSTRLGSGIVAEFLPAVWLTIPLTGRGYEYYRKHNSLHEGWQLHAIPNVADSRLAA